MVKFVLGMVSGITLLAAALTVFGKPTEVRFESGDQKLLEKIDKALAIAIRGLDTAHDDHRAQLQRDLAEAEILTRIEEKLGRRRILGAPAEELPSSAPELEDAGLFKRLEREVKPPKQIATDSQHSRVIGTYQFQYGVYVPYRQIAPPSPQPAPVYRWMLTQ